ncbi:hypothetical protein Ato02nite_005590 [Paractinoplanes toevensis]|uniref:Uncharacterized protein n=1 Tax=Paractinoplanes toevensis TaxID=571911 RepID=A0A919T732_9ACTN|nr:hypothetical protein Ato02nite_005590 [Actinoplanes toevensis]
MTTEKTAPTYNRWAWPTFNPAYQVARCGQLSAHGPEVVEHGPDQPRNCPGTGRWAECPRCSELVPVLFADELARHQVDGQWCEAEANGR